MTDGQFIATLVLVIVAIAGLSAIIKEKPDPDSHLPDAEPLDWNGTIRRKRDAKRFNEHLKFLSGFLNTVGAAFIVTGVLSPFVVGKENSTVWVVIAVLFAFMLHVAGHIVLRYWQSEE